MTEKEVLIMTDMVKGYINPYKLFVGCFLPNWLLERPELSLADKVVYAKLCQYAGKDGRCFPSQGKLAEDIGFSRQYISRSINVLVRKKLIDVTRKGLGKNNEYRFLNHKWITSRHKQEFAPDVNKGLRPGVNNSLHPIIRESYKENQLKKGKTGDPHHFDLAGNKKKLIDGHFEKFFEVYPKKTARRDARKAWGQIFSEAGKPYYFGGLTDDLMTAILEAVKTQSRSQEWQQENGRFIPHPATWLRGHRWEDKTVEMRKPCGGGGVVL